MIHLWILVSSLLVSSCGAQQFYDSSDCSSETSHLGSRYTCNDTLQKSCQAFVLYRANTFYQTISDISTLFRVNSSTVVHLNKLGSATEMLPLGTEVIVPIKCSCKGPYFRGNMNYVVDEVTEFSGIACEIFEGLVNLLTLIEENGPSQVNFTDVGSKLTAPLKCACPGNMSLSNGTVNYLVTYPFAEGDDTNKVAKKFGIPTSDIWEANHLDYRSTVYPNTTILVPLTKEPLLTFISPNSPPPSPGFLSTVPTERASDRKKIRNLYLAGSVIGFLMLLVVLIAFGLYLKALKRCKVQKLESFNTRSSQLSYLSTRSSPRSGLTGQSSTNSCLSPDLLIGIKYSLNQYSIEELKMATRDFSEDTKIDKLVYKGLLDNVEVVIKGSKVEETRRAIDVHSKINHVNILTLLGVCYDEKSNNSTSYLVFEWPSNGCLKDCLSRLGNLLHWKRRTQIAFDIATGLHYLHHCIFPSYAHMGINSRNIFITAKWRAKLGNIAAAPPAGSSKRHDHNRSFNSEGWVAPEYALQGLAPEKVDVFAFGVVLLELISAREGNDGEHLKQSIGFLAAEGNEGGCFEKLRGFMDPRLKEDYPLAEALCLAILAKACVEDDPMHRPSMDDAIKVLSRLL